MSNDKSRKPEPQKLKKSETLEVRIPYETKQAFLNACREDGTTASEVVRGSVQAYLDDREQPQPQPEGATILKFTAKLSPTVRRYGPRVAASAVAAIGLATFAVLPSVAAPDFQAQFKKFDVNGDGVITAEEFAGKGAGADGKAVVIETRHATHADAVPPAGVKPGDTKTEAFSFWLPEELASGQQDNQEMRIITRREVGAPNKGGAGALPDPIVVSVGDIRKKEFESYDTDKDGKVSFTEFQARQKAMLTRGFEMLDSDGDKFLSSDEYAKIVAPPMPKIDGLDDGDGPQIQIVRGRTVSPDAIKASFEKLDANKDNKLSLQEYLPPA